MKAYVMSAGVGTRLEPLTLAIPKPLVPICNIPVMQFNIIHLKKHGITDIAANLHYFPEQIKDYFKNGSQFGVKIKYSYEKKLLGTAGGVLNMARLNPPLENSFFVLSSDVLMNIDLSKLLTFHKKNKSLATIALVEVKDPTGLGVVVLDKNNRVCGFQEKPKKEEAKSRLINTGVYVFDESILEIITDENFFDFGHNLFPYLVKHGIPFYGFKSHSYWRDIGNPSNYMDTNFDAASGKIKICELNRLKDGSKNTIIGAKCIIEDKVVLKGKVVIGDNCHIKKGAEILDSIIWSETTIGVDVRINSSIIGSWCDVQNSTVINKNCIIANRCTIKANTSLSSNTKLSPGTAI